METDRGHRWAWVGGRGPFLLYLHGVGDVGSINPLLRRLADRYTIVRPDHPGFLGTDGAGCASVGDVAAYHVDLLEALEHQGEEGDGVVVVGSSFGGWVAAELALLAPTRVASLVLIDPAGLSGAEPAPDLYALDPATMVRMSFHAPDLKAGAKDLDDATRGVLRGNLGAARWVAPTMSDPTLAGRLPALSLPVTVVWVRRTRSSRCRTSRSGAECCRTLAPASSRMRASSARRTARRAPVLRLSLRAEQVRDGTHCGSGSYRVRELRLGYGVTK